MDEPQTAETTEPAGDAFPDPASPVTDPEPAMPEPMMIDLASEPLPPPGETDGDATANLA
jgi:hypothetical protein